MRKTSLFTVILGILWMGASGCEVPAGTQKFVNLNYWIPTDPQFQQQWHLLKIEAHLAWPKITDCSSVVVAVVDSGIDYTHPDLSGNMWTNTGETPGNSFDDDGNGYTDDYYGYNFVSGATDPSDPMDDFGHGTHVAGIIGAVGNNAQGTTGICWHARLMAVKVLDSTGSGDSATNAQGINYAVTAGAKVINMSLGGSGTTVAEATAMANALAAGVIVVAAAGNSSNNNDVTATWPANYSLTSANVMAVAATDQNDNLASFSNYGPTSVNIAAPGVDIPSTWPVSGGLYKTESGTSMASPVVAGSLALLWAAHPSFTYADAMAALYSRATYDSPLGYLVVGNRRVRLGADL